MNLQINSIASTSTSTGFNKVFPKNITKIQALPNQKVEVFIDGVKYNGSQLVNGKPIIAKKVGNDLLLELDGETLGQIDNFATTEGVSLDGANWSFSSMDGLTLSDGVLVSSTGPSAAAMTGLGGLGFVVAGLAAIGLASSGNGDSTPAGPTAQELALATIEAYNNGNGTTPAAPTLQNYLDAGVTGVSAANLAAVNAQVLKQAPGDANSPSDIQALVTAANVAMGKISQAAQNNTAASLTAADYADIGVTHVTAGNLAAINDALNSGVVNGLATDTVAKVQDMVDAFVAILAEANGSAADALPGTNPTAEQYTLIGAHIGSATTDMETLALLNDVVGAKVNTGVDTVTKIDVLARIANTVASQAAGANGLSMADLAAIGITGVNGLSNVNKQNVQDAIAATADNGSGVNTLAKIQALVNGAVDLTPPATPVAAPTSYDDNMGALQLGNSTAAATDDTTPGINIGAGLTDSPNLYVDGAKVAATYNSTSGTLTPTVALSSAPHALSYTLTDAAGNESIPSPARNITVDTLVQAPGMQLATDSGIPSTDGITNLATVNVMGLEPSAAWQYQLDGNGTWINGTGSSFNLSSGGHSYSVRQIDSAGNTSTPSASANFTLDNQVPTLLITDNRGNTTVNATDGNIVYTFTFSEAVNNFNSGDITVANGIKGPFTVLSPALYTLVVVPQTGFQGNVLVDVAGAVATDVAGNNNSVAVQNMQAIDTLVPSSPVINAVTSDDTVSAGEFTLGTTITGSAGSVEANATVTLTLGAGNVQTVTANGSGAWSYTLVAADLLAMGEGAETVSAVQTDAAGNVSLVGTRNITVDTLVSAPTIHAVATDDTVNAAEFTVGTTLTGMAEANAAVALTVGGTTYNLTANGAGLWSYTLVAADITAMGEGAETLSAVQTDVAGNVSLAGTRNIAIDTLVITPTINTLTADNTLNAAELSAGTSITGTADANASVALTLGAGNVRTVTANGTGVWSHTLLGADITAMGEGGESISAVQTDVAGNVSGSGPVLIAIDTVVNAPVIVGPVSLDNILTAADVGSAITGSAGSVEANATVTLTLGAGNVQTFSADGLGAWSYTLVAADILAMGEGSETLSAMQTDVAGNVSAAGTRGITVDTLATTANITMNDYEIHQGAGETALVSITFNEAVLNFAVTDVLAPSGTLGAFTTVDQITWTATFTPSVVADDLSNVLNLTASYTDVAGNTGNAAYSPNYQVYLL